MTIREQITNVVRALVEIPAVANVTGLAKAQERYDDMVRQLGKLSQISREATECKEGALKERDRVQGTLEITQDLLRRANSSIARLKHQVDGLVIEKKEYASCRGQRALDAAAGRVQKLEEELVAERKLSSAHSHAQSEVISELQSKNAALSARIRELETQAERRRHQLNEADDEKARLSASLSACNSQPTPTLADLFIPIEDKSLDAMPASRGLLGFRYRDGCLEWTGLVTRGGINVRSYQPSGATHFIPWEPPR